MKYFLIGVISFIILAIVLHIYGFIKLKKIEAKVCQFPTSPFRR